MLDLPPHLSDLIIKHSDHLKISGLQLRALIIHAGGAIGLHQRPPVGVEARTSCCGLTLIQGIIEDLGVVVLRDLIGGVVVLLMEVVRILVSLLV